jgi:hypothetical protein
MHSIPYKTVTGCDEGHALVKTDARCILHRNGELCSTSNPERISCSTNLTSLCSSVRSSIRSSVSLKRLLKQSLERSVQHLSFTYILSYFHVIHDQSCISCILLVQSYHISIINHIMQSCMYTCCSYIKHMHIHEHIHVTTIIHYSFIIHHFNSNILCNY